MRSNIANLIDKLAGASFRTDIETLIVATPNEYDIEQVADLVIEQLGSLLDNAPPLENIANGCWRNTA